MTGPEFLSLHQQFESHYNQIAVWIDDIAERARAIGTGARGNWTDLTNASRISADPGTGLGAQQMLGELLALYEELIVQLGADSADCAERFKDTVTADFLIGLMGQHEKTAWMLRSQLETETAETS